MTRNIFYASKKNNLNLIPINTFLSGKKPKVRKWPRGGVDEAIRGTVFFGL